MRAAVSARDVIITRQSRSTVRQDRFVIGYRSFLIGYLEEETNCANNK
jgi:hypothetical protein